MRRLARIFLCGGLLTVATAAAAQTGSLPGMDSSRQQSIDRLADNHWKLTGNVEIEREGVRLFADEIEYFTDTFRVIATGNVVFSTASHRIAADSADFNLKTKLGTFVHASGSATLGDGKPPSSFGAQEPDIYFYGKTVEKIGEQKYRVSDGGFTACVQPKPRWELTSGTVILNLDHYALLLNPIMRVKGVPVFYMPVIYYPINNDDRSTGFLLPVYGTSTLRGHTISNAFFWAIGRSHDATVVHDWFSNTGQGFGANYRYIANASSLGDARFYLIREKPTETTNTNGTVTKGDGQQGFDLRANVSQGLPFKLRGRARVDYFSNIQVQQTYSQNIYAASLRQRYYGGNLSGSWGAYTFNGSVDRTELFYSATSSITAANRPRLSFGRAERPLWRNAVYTSANAEFVSLVRQTTSGTSLTELDVNRMDFTPTLRVPFTRWPFLTINSRASWRFTRWNKSLDANNKIIEVPVNRSFFEMQSRIVGPVFSRIWNTNSAYAEKIKHTIEPSVTIQRSTAFDTYKQIVKLDGADYTIGGSTRVTYELDNKIYAKRPQGNRQGPAREIFAVTVRQTYYTDERASTVDGAYRSGFDVILSKPSKFSPISLQARAAPLTGLSANLTVEYDKQIDTVKSLGLTGRLAVRDWVSVSGGWNKQRYFFDLQKPSKITSEYQFLSGGSSVRLLNGRLGGDLTFNYDVTREVLMQRRFTGFYNIQCCGIAVEYQVYNFSGYGYFVVPKDKRFNISLTLAGLGTFSNFLGAFGGGTTQ